MSSSNALTTWLYRAGFIAVSVFAYFIGLLPLELGETRWHAPDLVLGFSFAWVVRRPDYVPLVILCGVLLIADFLFTRPPGLWAAISLLTLEFARRRAAKSRSINFLTEWAAVSALLLAMALIYRLALGIFLVPSASLGLVILQQIFTLVAYPIAVLITTVVFKVTRRSASEVDQSGLRS